jgi:formylglycine-generating enzyme required for sulfatase activity
MTVSGCSQELPARWIEPTTQMEFALLPAGTFVAGSPSTEIGHQADEVLYPVRTPGRSTWPRTR